MEYHKYAASSDPVKFCDRIWLSLIMNNFRIYQTLKKKPALLLIIILTLTFALFMLFQSSSKKESIDPSGNQAIDSQLSPSNQNFPQKDSNPALQKDQPLELKQAIEQQMIVDQEYADWQEASHTNYPWRKHLPLYNQSYYVYFDMNNQTFIALLYPKPNDNIAQIKADISNQLFNWGVNLENYQFEWRVSTQ